MCMKSEECKLAERVESLDARVDGIDQRLTRVETQQHAQTQLIREGFADLKAQIHDAYAEKVAWGDWARHALTDCGKWLGKWGGVIILAALGLANAKSIAQLFTR